MSVYPISQPWEYDEVAGLNWLPRSVRDAFSRLSNHSDTTIAFKYVHHDMIMGVGIARVKHTSHGPCLLIGHLNVQETYQGKGIGSALLNSFLEIAAKRNIACRLQVAPSNRKAQRLYGRFDFLKARDIAEKNSLWMTRKAAA
ncbi:MAG: GNAT family N-acetyltransferase [Pseudomonadota bacterium]